MKNGKKWTALFFSLVFSCSSYSGNNQLKINVKGMIVEPPCTISPAGPIIVDFGDIDAVTLNTKGESSEKDIFIRLTNCPAGKTISATLKSLDGTAAGRKYAFLTKGKAKNIFIYIKNKSTQAYIEQDNLVSFDNKENHNFEANLQAFVVADNRKGFTAGNFSATFYITLTYQ